MKSMKPIPPMQPMQPLQPMAAGANESHWWPPELGMPSASGAQNGMRYAFFPDKHRLLIERDGKLNTYDSGDHRISGVLQRNETAAAPSFTSQDGNVNLDELDQVS